MAKQRVVVVKGGDAITIKNHGEFRGEIDPAKYDALIEVYPQLKDQFIDKEVEVVEEGKKEEE